MLRIFYDYLDLSRREHLYFDFGVPVAISLLTVIILFMTGATPSFLVSVINSSIGVMITAFSILAGFNTASLSIIATSSSKVAQQLKENYIIGSDRKQMEQILAYFAWSVVFQLTLLFISMALMFVFAVDSSCLAFFQFTRKGVNLLWGLMFVDIIGVLYSIVLTIRNITILYKFLIAESR